MFWIKRAAGTAALFVVALLAGCGGKGDSSSSGEARVRLLNASSAYASLDFYVDDSKKNSGLAYAAVGEYATVGTSSLSTVITNTGSTSALSTTARTLSNGIAYTVVAYGWQGALKTALIEEDATAADSGKAKLMVLNTATDSGSVDVYLTGSDESLDDASAVASGVSGGAAVGYGSVGAGTYRLRITGAGDKTDLRLDVGGLTLASTQVATLIVTPGTGGVLTHALLAVQQGAVTRFDNSLARVRVVASVTGNGRVGLSVGSTVLMTAGTSPTIGNYATVAAGTPALSLVVNGAPVSVQNVSLGAGSDTTLLVWGAAATPQLAVINDDNRLPLVATNAKLRLIDGVNGLNGGLTLTADFTAVASDVLAGNASAYGNLTGASGMRLDVSSPLSSTALYSLTDATLAARGVYSMFMLGDTPTPTAALRKER